MSQFSNIIAGGNIGWYGNPTYGFTDKPVRDNAKEPTLGEEEKLALIKTLPPKMDGPNSVVSTLALATEANLAAAQGGANAAGVPFVPIVVAGGMYGWSASNGFQYIPPVYGNYNTYRLMADQPTINQAISLFRDPILSGLVRLEKSDDSVPDEWVDLVSKQVMPQMQMILMAALESIKFGFQPFEKIWSIVDGQYWCMLRPMVQDYTQIWISVQNGRFAGLSYHGEEDILPPNKCLVVSNEPQTGPYGKAMLDRTYEPFLAWQRTRIDQRKLRDKLAGILPILYYPPGKQPGNNPDGSDSTDNKDIATSILNSVGKGFAVTLPSAQFSPVEIARQPKLATTSLWHMDFYDAGSLAPAQVGNIEELEYNDVLFFRALSLPERSGQAGKHGGGTNAESETQSEGSVLSKETTAAAIAYQLSSGNPFYGIRGWIDDILLYNVGQRAVGKVFLKFAPLADYKLKYKSEIIKQALTQPTPASSAFFNTIDVNKALSDFGFELVEGGFDKAEFQKAVDAHNASKLPQSGGSGSILTNGSTKKPAQKRPTWVRKFAKGSK